MKHSTPRTSGRQVTRFGLLLSLLLIGGAGCDTILGTSDSEVDASIEGTWVLNGEDFTTYLRITSTTVTVYDGVEDECFDIFQFSLTSDGDDRYTVTDVASGTSFTLIIRREGDDLRVIDSESSNTTGDLFLASDRDLSTLEECAYEGWGGTDPDIDCSTLPAITLGQAIDGELASGDSQVTVSDDSWYYDLYGLTLDAQQQVTIAVQSSAFDTYLYLYQADGTYITENDDVPGGTTLNSEIVTDLSAGCFRVEVTSFWPDEVGAYTLTAD